MKKPLILLALAVYGCTGIPIPAAEPTPFPLGMKPSAHGARGIPIESHPRFNAAPLPRQASIRQWTYFFSQDNIGSCGPTSYRKVYDACFQKNNNGAHSVLSILDVYQRVLVAQGNFPEDAGVSNDVLLKIAKQGALLESTWGYVPSKLGTLPPNTSANRSERSKHQTLKGYVLPVNDNGYAAQQCIANIKIAPIIGTAWYNNGFSTRKVVCKTKDSKGKSISVTRYVVAYPKGQPVGGHDVPEISYDLDMVFPDGSVGGAEIWNHWIGWGDSKSCAWVPLRWFANPRFIDDPIAIEVVE